MKQLRVVRRFFVAVAFISMFTLLAHASNVIYVDSEAQGNNNGYSWDDAYRDLQDGLDAAMSGDDIWVARGTYKPSKIADPNDPRSATFTLIAGVKLYGGFAVNEVPGPFDLNYRDFELNETILSGDIGIVGDISDNSYHVVSFSVPGFETILDGFTITAGNANGTTYGDEYGGGVSLDSSHLIVSNCTFIGNRASTAGGGIVTYGTSPLIRLTNCKFYNNSSETVGGGLCSLVESSSNVPMVNCLFSGNSANAGGGFFNNAGDWILINCTFSMNLNVIPHCGAGVYNMYGNLTIYNSIIWGNTNFTGPDECMQLYTEEPGLISIDYSCVQGWTGTLGGTGNHGSDPFFVDVDGVDDIPGTLDDNLHLSFNSYCIDAGDNECVLESIAGDLEGNPRFIDDPNTYDTGSGFPPIVDMGAYEFSDRLRLYSAASRKYHEPFMYGGNFDINIPLHPAFGEAGIDCRSNGPTKVVLWFTKGGKAADGVIDNSEINLSCGSFQSASIVGSYLFINLSDVPNLSCLQIALKGIEDRNGKRLVGVKKVYIGVLRSDVNGDGLVNLVDLGLVKSNFFQLITGDNCRCDVNSDGIINEFDLGLVKADLFSQLDFCPED